jgi:antitoxin (DNA-binding transcriptional repressor) of toxin-antitoxin stability system
MEYKYIDSTEARENFASIINDAYATGRTYVVKKHGVPVAKIQKLTNDELDNKGRKTSKADRKKKIDMTLFGVLKDDPRDSITIANEWRARAWRGGKL